MMTASLCEKYRSHFLIGAAVNGKTIVNDDAILRTHVNSLTAENAMKPESVLKAIGEYDFSKADEIVSYAAKNNMKLRGHTLVWHMQTPSWFFEQDGQPASRQTMLERMKAHIAAMAEHFPMVYSWDVVNEAVEDKEDRILRDSPWTRSVGQDFVEQAFRFASLYMPTKQLVYNDYDTCNPVKREKLIRLLSSLLDKGVRVDAIGLQAHWNILSPTLEQVEQSIEAYAALGLRVLITEMDMALRPVIDLSKHQGNRPTQEERAAQVERYRDLFRLFRKHSDQIDSVTTWGITDLDSWLDRNHDDSFVSEPLLIDENGKPKPSMEAVLDF